MAVNGESNSRINDLTHRIKIFEHNSLVFYLFPKYIISRLEENERKRIRKSDEQRVTIKNLRNRVGALEGLINKLINYMGWKSEEVRMVISCFQSGDEGEANHPIQEELQMWLEVESRQSRGRCA